MTNQEIYEYYKEIPRGSRGRTITDHFNALTIEERKKGIYKFFGKPSIWKRRSWVTNGFAWTTRSPRLLG